ncbi:uncharacterized protein LOC110714370 [Chenopodium quinoa]|uniref:uncharacterized protein LOC110714370 n=1 Tax=Chenopodium quinoa TaxID=63459 RepID=UPI000B784FC6|nr:uncharacterized protein LOC110714370 [Chenopodium quinoa]
MTTLTSIPVSMEERLPNLAPDSLPITCLKRTWEGIKLLRFSSILGYSGHSRVDAMGFSGGIWVYWRPEFVTAIYASPDPLKRRELWEDLKKFATSHNKPWMLAGDFNDTRFPSERNSSCFETTRRSEKFNAWIEDMDLLEVEFSGAAHTWARGLNPETRRSGRLDRALCNEHWALRFEKASMKHISAVYSDHCPIFISPNGFAPLQSLHRPFKFQASWLLHEKFQNFVKDKWEENSPLMPALSKLSSDLQNWNREVFGNIFKQKRSLLARIGGVQKILATRVDRGLLKLEAKLRRKLDEILSREETLWYQKSRIDWLKDGDRNTTFFHLSTIVRRWRNKIVALKDNNGVWIQDKGDI